LQGCGDGKKLGKLWDGDVPLHKIHEPGQ
jgi:hypothetical protein